MVSQRVIPPYLGLISTQTHSRGSESFDGKRVASGIRIPVIRPSPEYIVCSSSVNLMTTCNIIILFIIFTIVQCISCVPLEEKGAKGHQQLMSSTFLRQHPETATRLKHTDSIEATDLGHDVSSANHRFDDIFDEPKIRFRGI